MSDHGLMTQRRDDNGRLVISLHGELDLSTCGPLGAQLYEAAEQSPEVQVDLAGVSFLDSSGIRVLVDAHRTAAGLGHVLYIDNAHGWVERVLEVTGVLQVLRKP